MTIGLKPWKMGELYIRLEVAEVFGVRKLIHSESFVGPGLL